MQSVRKALSRQNSSSIDLDSALASLGIGLDIDEYDDLLDDVPQAYLVTFKDPNFATSVGSNLVSQRFKTLLKVR